MYKEVMNLKEGLEGHMVGIGGRKWKEEML